MRQFCCSAAFLFAACVFYSCTQELELPLTPVRPEENLKELTIIASAEPDPETRTTLHPDGKLYWQPGDQISLFYGMGDNGGRKFTSTITQDALKANFRGTIDVITGGGEDSQIEEPYFWGVYPYREDIVCDGTTITTTLADVQTAVEGNFDRGLFISVGRSKGMEMPFYNVCGGIRFSVCHEGIVQIIFSGNNNEVLAGRVKVGFDSNGKPEVQEVLDGKTTITVNAPNGGTFEVGKTYYIITLPKTGDSSLSVGMRASFVKGDMTNYFRKWRSNVQILRNDFMEYLASSPFDKDEKTTYYGNAVDLGGSVLWATKNVGAAEVGDYGEYYQWGATTPSDRTSYQDIKTKYQNPSLTTLEPEDDAATVNWGGYWRTPTYDELNELPPLANRSRDSENNHSGIRYTKNGSSIFIPYAGRELSDGSVEGTDNYIYLWSASKSNNSPKVYYYYARNSDLTSTFWEKDLSSNHGHTIRPVLSKPVAATSVVLDKTSVRLNVGATEQLTATVLPDNAFRKGVRWTSSNTSVASVSATGMIGANGEGTATITATSMDGAATATCEVTVIESQSSYYVMMGPDQFWATCNVGAELPTDTGDLFAWGETAPKESYSWVNYRWLTPNYLTKYQSKDNNLSAIWYGVFNAFIGDAKTILDPEDDAATVNWGADWRTPTKSEWSWLLDNSTSVATRENGVPGVRITSTVPGYEQSSIFLPYGANGCYWSSSLYLDDSSKAHEVSTANGSNGYTTLFFSTREHGYMVRPVHSSPVVHVSGVSLDQSSIILPWINRSQPLTATIAPADATETALVWTSSDPSVATVSEDGVVTGVGFGLATISVTTDDGLKSASCEVNVNYCEGHINGHKYVDMGNGLKWATCNLPDYSFEGQSTEDTDPWVNENYFWWSWDSSFDRSTRRWGNDWRTPTKEEFEWLIANCDMQTIEEHGVSGKLITSRVTHMSIFLPFRGYREGGEYNYLHDSYNGFYWSSTPHENETGKEYYFDISRDMAFMYWFPKTYEMSIRSVSGTLSQ